MKAKHVMLEKRETVCTYRILESRSHAVCRGCLPIGRICFRERYTLPFDLDMILSDVR